MSQNKKFIESALKTKSTILSNIKKTRISKAISSKEMAYEIGVKPCDYCKFENGTKKNWIKYIDKVAEKLDVNKYELYLNSDEYLLALANGDQKIRELFDKQNQNYIDIFTQVDEVFREKDEKILKLTEEINRLKCLYKVDDNNPDNFEKDSDSPINREREREREKKGEKVDNRSILFKTN